MSYLLGRGLYDYIIVCTGLLKGLAEGSRVESSQARETGAVIKGLHK